MMLKIRYITLKCVHSKLIQITCLIETLLEENNNSNCIKVFQTWDSILVIKIMSRPSSYDWFFFPEVHHIKLFSSEMQIVNMKQEEKNKT